MNCKNKELGRIREKRAQAYMENVLKWQVFKTTIALDKWHAIDFTAIDKNNKRIVIQVKGFSQLNKPANEKAIEYARKYKNKLYYFYIGSNYYSKIYVRKFYDPEEKYS